MDRVFRRAKSMISAKELLALVIAVVFAVLASCGALVWYKTNSKNNSFIVAINEVGGVGFGRGAGWLSGESRGEEQLLPLGTDEEAHDMYTSATRGGRPGGQASPSYLAVAGQMNTTYIYGSHVSDYHAIGQDGTGQAKAGLAVSNPGSAEELNGTGSGIKVNAAIHTDDNDNDNDNGSYNSNDNDNSSDNNNGSDNGSDNHDGNGNGSDNDNDIDNSNGDGTGNNNSGNGGDSGDGRANRNQDGEGHVPEGGEQAAGATGEAGIAGTAGATGEAVSPADAGSVSGGGGINADSSTVSDNADAGNGLAATNSHGNIEDAQVPAGQAEMASREPEKPKTKLFNVTIKVDGGEKKISIAGKKIKNVLEEAGVSLSANDKLSGAKLEDVLSGDLTLTVKRVTYKNTTEEQAISAKTVYRDNSDVMKGVSKVISEGKDGLKKLEYKITYEDGKQVDKKLVNETVVREAADKVVEQGTANIAKLANNSEVKYTKAFEVKCTAYSSSFENTGKRPGDPGYGITASGMKAQKGVVAVDPKVIPLGTKLYIEILDDSIEDYGYAVAGDTGRLIKGNKVDLYFEESMQKLREFGVRNARVYILE